MNSKSTFLPGLKKCINDHPPLSVIVKKPKTEKPFYESCTITDLEKHIDILPAAKESSDLEAIEKVSPSILDTLPSKNIPPWKIVVLPLFLADGAEARKCFVAFAFSHALGDGISGLAFHKSFLAGLQNPDAVDDGKVKTSAMARPFDTAKNLPISWSYLLAPALGAYLPKFVGKALGFRAAVSEVTPTTWLGSESAFLNDNHRSGAKFFAIDNVTISKLIEACRNHDTKFTSLFHQIIVHALSVSVPQNSNVDNFASQTAINMRHHVDVSNDEMGIYVTGYFDVHTRTADTSKIWESARDMNAKLHACASTLQDQSIGLLRYLPSMRSWTTGHLGGKRDCSYEVSNLLAFDPGTGARGEGNSWTLGNMAFTQPANVTSAPLHFNLVARKGQDLVGCAAWQIGALGVGNEEGEYEFVGKVCEEILKCVHELVVEESNVQKKA